MPEDRRSSAACRTCAAVLLLAAASSGAVVYIIYHPRVPTFSVARLPRHPRPRQPHHPSSLLSPELDATVGANNSRNKKVGIKYRVGRSVTVSYSRANGSPRGGGPCFSRNRET